jgi:hypothetical protein
MPRRADVPPLDPPAVRARAAALARRTHVAYWIVLSGHDGYELLAGRVPAAVRGQVLDEVKRGRAESAEEYAARVAELR